MQLAALLGACRRHSVRCRAHRNTPCGCISGAIHAEHKGTKFISAQLHVPPKMLSISFMNESISASCTRSRLPPRLSAAELLPPLPATTPAAARAARSAERLCEKEGGGRGGAAGDSMRRVQTSFGSVASAFRTLTCGSTRGGYGSGRRERSTGRTENARCKL